MRTVCPLRLAPPGSTGPGSSVALGCYRYHLNSLGRCQSIMYDWGSRARRHLKSVGCNAALRSCSVVRHGSTTTALGEGVSLIEILSCLLFGSVTLMRTNRVVNDWLLTAVEYDAQWKSFTGWVVFFSLLISTIKECGTTSRTSLPCYYLWWLSCSSVLNRDGQWGQEKRWADPSLSNKHTCIEGQSSQAQRKINKSKDSTYLPKIFPGFLLWQQINALKTI